jgi:predicted ATP-grasp superfamily ATP-dependent carboligase
MPDGKRRPHVIIAGVTTRPLAVSAARAGYRVTAIDAFGDLDLRTVASVILARPEQGADMYGPVEAAIAGSAVEAEFAAYTSNFENYPPAVARLALGRSLLGNGPLTLARVRNPLEVMRSLRRHGVSTPESRSRPPEKRSPEGPWLLKPRRSGGGHGVAPWEFGRPIPKSMYIQERITGVPGSISFAGDGVNAVVLGISRQLVGYRELGAGRFRYCGSLLATPNRPLFRAQKKLLDAASGLATTLTREFELKGLNGVDFIARAGVPYPIEVNPRYSASMELIERAHRISMFAVHARACQGTLPAPPPPARTVHGKAVVFARTDGVVGNSRQWAARIWVADVPRPGEYIPRGRPICTVFASAGEPGTCRELLLRRARSIYRAMKAPAERAA